MKSVFIGVLLWGFAVGIDATSQGGRNGSISLLPSAAARCGQSSHVMPSRWSLLTSHVWRGYVAKPSEVPWQCIVKENGFHRCGCSLVADRNGKVKSITAAHCLVGVRAKDLEVHFGNLRADSVDNGFQVQRIDIHKRFDPSTLDNDIAVMSFGSVRLGDLPPTAFPICMPSKVSPEGERALLSGWGSTAADGSRSALLKVGTKPVLSRTVCDDSYTKAGVAFTDSMMCAGIMNLQRTDGCLSDPGGPLAAKRGSNYELIGIASFGGGCAKVDMPSVYTDVYHFRDWLRKRLIV